MMHTQDSTIAVTRSGRYPAATNAAGWQTAAIAAYQHAPSTPLDHLRQELASRIYELTGQAIEAEATVTDATTRTATTTLGGVVFQLQHHTLGVLRPCVQCGVGRLVSPTIEDVADLGYALAGWEPRCAHCVADDEDWSHSF